VTQVRAAAVERPGLRFLRAPAGVQAGDYVVVTVDGNDVYHRLGGVAGELGMLDHAFAGGERPVPVFVKKMGLPPYALGATLATVAFGVLVTLLEAYGPRRLRAFLPSVAGIGIAMVVTCWDPIAMAIGSVIAWIIGRAWPRIAERYTVSTASGVVAGASLMGLAVILFRDILTWIQPPE
jgi:hypothetical protein